jgi:predicted Zn-dependent protease
MQMVRRQLLVGVLMGSSVLVGALPTYGEKNLNDPGKIGHRTVARRSIIAPAKEAEIGKEDAARFERTVELVEDPWVVHYVTTMAENVVRNSDWKGPVTVKVIKSPDIDSFSLPGGLIYLTSELLLSAESEDEIAGALAHQVAHAAVRHWASEVTKMVIVSPSLPIETPWMGIIMTCPGTLGSWRRRGGAPLAFLKFPLAFLKFRRQDELEADYLGLQYMYRAGYDPNAYVALLRKVALSNASFRNLPDLFQEMPPVSQRIAKAEEEIHKILPNSPKATKASPQFILIKISLVATRF